MKNTNVIFKPKLGKLWIKAEVIKKTKAGYFLKCGRDQFYIKKQYVKAA
jgi:hypothetical protein